MKRVMLFSLACIISLAMQPFPASVTTALPAQISQVSDSVRKQAELHASYGALPLSFELNQGQTDGTVDFLARAGGYLLFLTPTEAVMAFDSSATHSDKWNREDLLSTDKNKPQPPRLIVRMKLEGANPATFVEGLDELTSRTNYFSGSDPAQWHTDIPTESNTINLDNTSDFPALMLFVERARAVQPDFNLTNDNIQMMAAICAYLDGLPLVIELIAARMRFMSPQALLERLSGQFVLTADGMCAASERQKTLNHAIGWSYNLLSETEQKLFTYLSVFSGGFALADAEAVFANNFSEKSVPELLTLLLDKNLIRRAANESSEDRCEMLVTIQEYALERLRDRAKKPKSANGT